MARAGIATIALAAAVLGGCGTPSQDSAATTLEEPPAPLPAGCSPPKALVRFTSGFATVDITSGPGTGRLQLPTAGRRTTSNYSAGSGDLRGEWRDEPGNLLIVHVEDANKCQGEPRGYVQIEPQGRTGPRPADTLPRFAEVYPPRSCTVELSALSARGVDGAFTCTRLGGGEADHGSGWAGPGIFIDASGTFSLRA